MDQVVCQECAEIVFIHVSMACDPVVLQFRGGKSVRALESTSNDHLTGWGVRTSVSEKGRNQIVPRVYWTVGIDLLSCQECAEIVFIQVWTVCNHWVLHLRREEPARSPCGLTKVPKWSPEKCKPVFPRKGGTKSLLTISRRSGMTYYHARSVPR